MLTEQEQREQQAVLQELLAGPDQALVDAARACQRPVARIAARRQAGSWSLFLAAGAVSSHVMLVLSLLALLFSSCPGLEGILSGSEGLLLASAFLAPLATLCSLLAILMVRSHLNGLARLIGMLTLPLNMILCWGLYVAMTFQC